ncbi:MAG: DNA topoisomerase [Candidatus Hodarchaeales archaeon]|jgi:DNA topoisomerase-1
MNKISKSILIVAEKPSIARSLVKALATVYSMKFKTKKGKTRFNSFFESVFDNEFTINIQEIDDSLSEIKIVQNAKVRITSVSGHLTSFDYPPPFDKKTNWLESDPIDLIKLEPIEFPISEALFSQIEEAGINIDLLAIATDWDSQGESIGGQIARIASKSSVNDIEIARMRFTSTSVNALHSAFENQFRLDDPLIKSVDSLRKQDLRMGASITRFLTAGIQNNGKGIRRLISYGPCQSSVLWIVTDRFIQRLNFVPEPYWRILAKFKQEPIIEKTKKSASKGKTKIKKATKAKKKKKLDNEFIFERQNSPVNTRKTVDDLLERIGNITEATVKIQKKNSQAIERPKPLDTDTLEADCSRLFNVGPKLISDISEKLYNNGFITYPRTESSHYIYNDLTPACKKFYDHQIYGPIAKGCVESGTSKKPSKGRFTKDHEPITPVKAVTEKEVAEALKGSDFENNLAWRIYDYVVRRFFSTISKNGVITIITTVINVEEENFEHEGQNIKETGFLDIFPFKKIRENPFPKLKQSENININITEKLEHTVPPNLWTESQLIREMSRLNIGTDATRSQHIQTIQNRGFARVQKPRRSLLPTELGQAFFKIFIDNAEELIIPKLRETVESWTKQIHEGTLSAKEVDNSVINLTETNLKQLASKREILFPILIEGIEKSTKEGQSFGPCDKCGSVLILKHSMKNKRYLSCSNDECDQKFPVPKKGELYPLEEKCHACELYPIQVGTGTKSWIFCPSCWINRQDNEGLLFCSRCDYSSCPYSLVNRDFTTKTERGRLGTCTMCLEGEVALFFDEWRTVIECLKCKTKWNAPNIRAGTSIEINGLCKLCNMSTLAVKRKNKSAYNICPFCSLPCYNCIHRCYG